MSQDREYQAKPSVAGASTLSAARSSTDGITFRPKTELGSELWALRQKIVASGQPLLTADEIDREVTRRRGGLELSD
jgi:hypothetical protein